MTKEVTVIFRDGGDVGLGILDETGRKFHHIRFIKNAGQGGTELADKAVEIPIELVEIHDGFDYQALIAFQDRNRAVLEWRGQRQLAMYDARDEAMHGVEKRIATTMKRWDRENPEPISGTPEESPPTTTYVADGQVHSAKFDPHEDMAPDAAHSHADDWPAHEHHDGMTHIFAGPEPLTCSECEMQEPYHAVDCSKAPPDDEDDEQEPLSDYQRSSDPPSEEKAQETAPVGDEPDF